MRCARCDFVNLDDARFCQDCGERLERVCTGCGTSSPPDSRFCRQCGQALDTVPVGPSPGRRINPPAPAQLGVTAGQVGRLAQAEGERKIVTALFADIKGSMSLIETMDADLAGRIIDPALRLMRAAVDRYDGFTPMMPGDGIFALFGAPVAHEDHANRAIHAALQMQQDMQAYSETLQRQHSLPGMQIRIGINTGDTVLRSITTARDRTELVTIGHATSLAARLEGLATAGSILVSETTWRLTRGYFDFLPLGSHVIKGASQPVVTYRVIGLGRRQTRLDAPGGLRVAKMIGRDAEIRRMQQSFRQACTGHGQMIGLVGDAGVGKSRLTREFKWLVGSDCLVLEGAAMQHGARSPWFVLIDVLRRHFEIKLEDDEETRLARVRNGVQRIDPDLVDSVPFLLALLGVADPAGTVTQMDPGIRRHRTFEAIEKLILALARQRPVLLIIEDLHWADAETEQFLARFSLAVPAAPIMLVLNHRPDFASAMTASLTTIRLGAFGAADAADLLDKLVGSHPSIETLKARIIEKTQGNAFFIEEYVQTLFDEGVLKRGAPVTLARAPASIEMPATVQGVLAARIDRLDPSDKAFLQLIAVLGMATPLGLIERVGGFAGDETRATLARLLKRGFVQARAAELDIEYVFRHALTRETAYGELLSDTRQTLHARAAAAMEAHYADRLADVCGEIAQHYLRSNHPTKAIAYLQMAGLRAMERSAYVAAIDDLQTALRLLPKVEDAALRQTSEIRLQATLGAALTATLGFAVPEVRAAYERARELCSDQTELDDLLRVLSGLGLVYINSSNLDAAAAIGEEMLTLAKRRQSDELFVAGHEQLGLTLLRRGELASCRAHLGVVMRQDGGQTSDELRRSMGRDPAVSSLAFDAMARWLEGDPDAALEDVTKALQATHAVIATHPFSIFYALHPAYWIHQFRREAPQAETTATQAATLAAEHGFSIWLAHSHVVRGWAVAEQGRVAEGLDLMSAGEEGYAATGGTVWQPMFRMLRADALSRRGEFGAALAAVDEGLEQIAGIGAYWWEAELVRMRGEMLLKTDGAQRAEGLACFHHAAAIAQRQGARSLELRARLSEARHRRSRDAYAALEAVLLRFTEGFSCLDLLEARDVLREAAYESPRKKRRGETLVRQA